jgi:hypothetical protein
MKKWQRLAIIIFLFCLPPAGIIIYGFVANSGDEDDPSSRQYAEVDWNLLRQLDYKTGQAQAELKAQDGKRVKIPGYVVPLDDDMDQSPEFLLVPSPQACVHVPPPPPNQMILVRMGGGTTPKRSWGPVWVKGMLQIQETDSPYGKIAFKLIGEDAEKYVVQW